MELQSNLSKKYLAESLISLMKKSFSAITNKEITDKAGLSHITIYRNFKNKEEIIKYYLDHITDEFIKNTNIIFNPNDLKKYLMILFTHLEKNKEIGMLLYRSHMIHHLKEEFDQIFLNKAHNIKEQYQYSFISGGLYNLYYIWIKNGCKESPSELASMFDDFYILANNIC